MAQRSRIGLKTKLAAALCELLQIPYEHAVLMTEDQVISLVAFDHYPVPHAQGGPDTHYNLVPRPLRAHAEKTAKIDIPQIAKTKRISAEHQDFVRRVLTIEKKPREKSSRFPRGRKLRSRGFEKRRA